MHTYYWFENINEREQLEDLVVEGRKYKTAVWR
jgi:hypothetical protein